MPFSFHLAFPQGRPESGLPFENSLLHQQTPGYILPAFYLSAIYRCVTRSCNKVVRKNLYHRKFSGIPRLSRYSCRNFSLSSSVGAVLDLLYTSRFTIASSFFLQSQPDYFFAIVVIHQKNIAGVEKITRMESVHFYFASVLLSRWQDSLFLRNGNLAIFHFYSGSIQYHCFPRFTESISSSRLAFHNVLLFIPLVSASSAIFF